MDKNEDIIFQVSDWEFYHEVDDNDEDEISKYVINMYGTTLNRKKIYVKITDFTPFFFVKIPKNWRKQKVNLLMQTVKNKVQKEHQKSLVRFDIVDRYDFWGFTNYKMGNFIRLVFHSFDGFRAYERVFKRKIYNPALFRRGNKYKLYESNFEPMLRCMHIRKINACGWVKIPGKKNP
jgi:hypothetical protein